MGRSSKRSCRSRSTTGAAMLMVVSKDLWWAAPFLVSFGGSAFSGVGCRGDLRSPPLASREVESHGTVFCTGGGFQQVSTVSPQRGEASFFRNHS